MARVRAAGVLGQHGGDVLLQPAEIGSVGNQAILGGLDVAGAELARRQRCQTIGVGQHQARLMEGADQVLALRRVDAGLAADGGVDLRQQRGRHLHEADAATHDARRKAGEIADHAAAERDDEIAALEAHLEQALAQPGQAGEALRRLAGGQNLRAGVPADGLQACFERRQVAGSDIGVRDDAALGLAGALPSRASISSAAWRSRPGPISTS